MLEDLKAERGLGPHSLGKLIEWKRSWSMAPCRVGPRPHSLGKLIEWKLIMNGMALRWISIGPHSLGKLIEWKHDP